MNYLYEEDNAKEAQALDQREDMQAEREEREVEQREMSCYPSEGIY
jgi:hypothetical protein